MLYFDTLLYILVMNSILHLNCKLHCIVPTKGEQYAYTCELSCIIVHSSLEPYAHTMIFVSAFCIIILYHQPIILMVYSIGLITRMYSKTTQGLLLVCTLYIRNNEYNIRFVTKM